MSVLCVISFISLISKISAPAKCAITVVLALRLTGRLSFFLEGISILSLLAFWLRSSVGTSILICQSLGEGEANIQHGREKNRGDMVWQLGGGGVCVRGHEFLSE